MKRILLALAISLATGSAALACNWCAGSKEPVEAVAGSAPSGGFNQAIGVMLGGATFAVLAGGAFVVWAAGGSGNMLRHEERRV